MIFYGSRLYRLDSRSFEFILRYGNKSRLRLIHAMRVHPKVQRLKSQGLGSISNTAPWTGNRDLKSWEIHWEILTKKHRTFKNDISKVGMST